jgi:hypothetical protein
MSESRLPKVNEIVKDIGTIVAVFNGYVEVLQFKEIIVYMNVPTYQLKWNQIANHWEVA